MCAGKVTSFSQADWTKNVEESGLGQSHRHDLVNSIIVDESKWAFFLINVYFIHIVNYVYVYIYSYM